MTRVFPVLEHELVVSASQLSTADHCMRKWWFKKMGLKEPPKDHFAEGNCLHAVMERHLLADERGNDKTTGQPVDLYPPGWDADVSPMFAQLCKKLVAAAIDSGQIIREPGARIEHPVILELTPDIGLIGFMDVDHQLGVDDHKTTSNMRWARSPKQLANELKMLVYAYAWIMDHHGADYAGHVRLKHNVFLKDADNPKFKPTDVMVTAADVIAYWNGTIMPLAQRMLEVKRANTDLKDWARVPGPDDEKTCKKYGGCPYARVCGRVESPQAHIARMERILKGWTKPTEAKEDNMDITKKLLAKKAANSGLAASAPAVPTTTTAQAVQAGSAVETAQQVVEAATQAPEAVVVHDTVVEPVTKVEAALQKAPAPWANKGCKACQGSGYNAKTGLACGACDAYNRIKKLPTSDTYSTPLPDVVQEPKVAAPAPVETVAVAPVKEKKPRAKKVKEDPVEEASVQVSVPIEAQIDQAALGLEAALLNAVEANKEQIKEVLAAPAAQAASPALIQPNTLLLINAAPLRAGPSTDLHYVFTEITAKIAKLSDVSDFMLMDAWKRKDTLAIHVKAWAKSLKGGEILTAIGGGQDFKVMVDTLRMMPSICVIQGVL